MISARAAQRAANRRRIGQPISAKRRSDLRFGALIVMLLAGGVCVLLGLNTASAADEVREQDLSSSIDDLSGQADVLQRSLAGQEAPSALASAAAALGMIPGKAPAFLVIGPDGSASVLGDPSAAPTPAPPPTPTPIPTPTPTPTATPTPTPTATDSAPPSGTDAPPAGATPPATDAGTSAAAGTSAGAPADPSAPATQAPTDGPTPAPGTAASQ